ncbi:hypothetical protein [Orientia tsutsugamushi]|uniref:hypothetical protein n=1 Tax=Orientia tsutsugamushi TaxID=784 RepID=UPI00123A9565|nr:hypothetical protein [Orientia tsutsugamushi]QES95869.1 hypothetical protein F0363_02925 [Orientia tsutsugamushi]
MSRNEFIERMKAIPKDKIVFIDKSGIEYNACRNYGLNSIGRMCYGEKAYQGQIRIRESIKSIIQ